MCEKHKERKRPNTCPDCRAEIENDSNESSNAMSQTEVVDSNIELEPIVTESQHRMHDSKAIRVMIEAEIHKAISKVKSELSDLSRITWEHMHIPHGTFCLELMYALEKDGWKYCDSIRNGKQFGYAEDGDFFLIQRINRKDNPSKPDFSKSGSVRRYIDKQYGRNNV